MSESKVLLTTAFELGWEVTPSPNSRRLHWTICLNRTCWVQAR